MLPIAPIAATATAPAAPENEAPESGGSFDSLLQQSTGEPADSSGADEPGVTADEPAVDADVVNAAAQAGLFAMLFAAPPIAPQPALATEVISANPIGDIGEDSPRESTAFFSEETAPAPARFADRKTQEPTAPAARHTRPEAKPETAAQPARAPAEPAAKPLRDTAATPQDAKLLPAKEAASAHEVANVLGIIPPVQVAPDLSGDPAISTTPAVATTNHIPAAVTGRPVEVTPTVAPTSGDAAASDEPAIAAGSAPVIAPATSAAPSAQPIPAKIAAPVPRAPETLSQPVVIAAVSKAIEFTGMTAAKPGDGMPAPTLQQPPRPAPVTSAEPVSTEVAPAVASIDGTQTLHAAPVPAAQNGREHSAHDHAENAERPPTPEFAAAGIPREMATVFSGSDAIAPIRPADVAQAVTQTFRAAEQMRVSGQERVEVAVKLDGGHDIIIHLRMANGEVTPTIRTESEPLRLALEQNWSRFSQRGSDSDLRIATPVFESPRTSSNMSDLNQQRDQRQRAFNEPAHEFHQSQTPRRGTPLHPQRPISPAPTPSSSVSLYA